MKETPMPVEVAWRVFSETGTQVGKGRYEVQLEGKKTTDINTKGREGSSQNTHVQKYPLPTVLTLLDEASDGVNIVVVHNASFVRGVLRAAYDQVDKACAILRLPTLSLMQQGMPLYRRRRNAPNGYPTLQELRDVLTGQTYQPQNPDAADVSTVVTCYWKLLAQGEIEHPKWEGGTEEKKEQEDGPTDRDFPEGDSGLTQMEDLVEDKEVFEAGFYVDELDRLVRRVLSRSGTSERTVEAMASATTGEAKKDAKAKPEHPLTIFYRNQLRFRLTGPTSVKPGDSPDPLLAVASNFLVRGRPTRATLCLSDYIFRRYFPEASIELNDTGSAVSYIIPNTFCQDWEPSSLRSALLSPATYANGASTTLNAVVEALQFLVFAAQLQIALMRILRDSGYEAERPLSVYVHGAEQSAVVAVVQDLNRLLAALYRLHDPEGDVPFIMPEDTGDEAAFVLEVEAPIHLQPSEDTQAPSGANLPVYTIEQLPQPRAEGGWANRRLLSAPLITYPAIGTLHKEQIGEREVQTFHYHHEAYEQSLKYLLRNAFRKRDFFPGQLPIINRALQGMDVIGLLPTGGGKSLTYQLAALLQPGTTLIVDPINSLMRDQYDKLREAGITTVAYINYHNTKKERQENVDRTKGGELLFLFVGPERFQIQSYREMFLQTLTSGHYFSHAVIDEAHCVSEWGHDFRQSYLQLADNIQRFCAHPEASPVPVFGLTATASFDVLADVQRELGVEDEAVITLPPRAIDREELHFRLLRTEKDIAPDLEYWEREKVMGWQKYDQIEDFIRRVPEELHKLQEGISPDEISEAQLSREQRRTFFEADEEEGYKDSGIIFCPTKSDKLGNGVLALNNGYRGGPTGLTARLPFLEVSTFFSGQDDETVKDDDIQNEADKSLSNQQAFVGNRTNLMIATKAFGMGIDKPNIRYTVHYTMPPSVESFYQEAGRAGRDRDPALCALLYHPEDVKMNLDFAASSFKGIEREQAILSELLEEVRYKEGFTQQYLASKLRDKFRKQIRVNLFPTGPDETPFLLYINGPWHDDPKERICYGCLKIDTLDPFGGQKYVKGVSTDESTEVLYAARELIKKHSDNQPPLDWLLATSTEGIAKRLQVDSNSPNTVLIGFISDTIDKLVDYLSLDDLLIHPSGPSREDDGFKFKRRMRAKTVIRDGYRFSDTPEDFISNLEHAFGKATKFTESLDLGEEQRQFLQRHFYHIRNANDTQRAVYRLSVLGIIDDYVVDYWADAIELRFHAKEEQVYKERLRSYLRRYLGESSTEEWVEKVEEHQAQLTEEHATAPVLKSYLWTLTEFVYEEMARKRTRAVDYMDKLCALGLQQGEEAFRQNIIYYFTSKYARMEHLPQDLDQGKEEDITVVTKYIGYIFDPPDGLGGQIDNAKHLRGACARLRMSQAGENATLDLLNAFSLLALIKDGVEVQSPETVALISEAKTCYYRGFRRFARIAPWERCLQTMQTFHSRLRALSTSVEEQWRPHLQMLLLERTTDRVRSLNEML